MLHHTMQDFLRLAEDFQKETNKNDQNNLYAERSSFSNCHYETFDNSLELSMALLGKSPNM